MERFITKLDCKRYCAIPLTQKTKSIIAIITQDELYQFRVMPFGLKTTPAAFQQMMLADLESISVYLDDLVLATNTWNGHLTGLRQIFSGLWKAN